MHEGAVVRLQRLELGEGACHWFLFAIAGRYAEHLVWIVRVDVVEEVDGFARGHVDVAFLLQCKGCRWLLHLWIDARNLVVEGHVGIRIACLLNFEIGHLGRLLTESYASELLRGNEALCRWLGVPILLGSLITRPILKFLIDRGNVDELAWPCPHGGRRQS